MLSTELQAVGALGLGCVFLSGSGLRAAIERRARRCSAAVFRRTTSRNSWRPTRRPQQPTELVLRMPAQRSSRSPSRSRATRTKSEIQEEEEEYQKHDDNEDDDGGGCAAQHEHDALMLSRWSFCMTHPGDMLGMDVKHKKGMWLVVAKIDEGAVARANASGLNGETLQISDVIYEINGVKGDDALMVAECKKSSKLEMKVKRMSTPM
eukprot:s2145_g3.t1